MNKALKLTSVVMIIGVSISFVTLLLVRHQDLTHHFKQEIPTSWFDIFKHNCYIYILFCIPLFSIIQYFYSFFIIFVSIGLVFSHIGILQSLWNLKHLPIELFALSIPITVIHSKSSFKDKCKDLAIGVFILVLSSWIEFYF